MKKKVIILWIGFVACVVLAVVFWFAMNNAKLDYDEVEVEVISAVTKQVKNRKNGATYNTYEIKVEYEGETYDLENAHSTYEYPRGKKVKAYLSHGKLYANVEGVRTSTPVATVYFVFLFGSLIMLFVASTYTGKLSQSKKSLPEDNYTHVE